MSKIDELEKDMSSKFLLDCESVEFWRGECERRNDAKSSEALERAQASLERKRQIAEWYFACNKERIINDAIGEAADKGIVIELADEVEIATSWSIVEETLVSPGQVTA